MDAEIYQEIIDLVIDFLPEEWDKVILGFQCDGKTFGFLFYVKVNDEYKSYKRCGDYPEESCTNLMMSLKSLISTVREEMDDKWSAMTMVVDSDGMMNTDFDYVDLSENKYDYLMAWQKKYLS